MERPVCIALAALLVSGSLAEASDRPAGYVLQETISVPVDGSSVRSTPLAAGANYKIRASGTFTVGGNGDGRGDAEYANFIDPPGSLQDVCGLGSFGEDLGLGIDDAVNDSRKSPYWGSYSPTHEYTTGVGGTGASISLNYHDCNYADNRGSLTVEIFREAAVTVQLNQTVFTTGQTMVITPCLSPGYIGDRADVYVVVQPPNGTWFSLQLNGGLTPRLVPLVNGFAWPPASVPPAPLCVEFLRYTFTGAEPAGTYTWYSAATVPGTLNVIGPLAAVTFTFNP